MINYFLSSGSEYKNDFLKGNWKCRKLVFYYFPFLLYHYKLGDSDDEPEAPNDDDISADNNNQMMADMMSSASDFCPVGPTPAIMFGLREVIIQ